MGCDVFSTRKYFLMKKEVLIFGGSFNPPHNGHVALCEHVLRCQMCDEVWLMVSPLNPLKSRSDLIASDVRLAMAQKAFEGIEGVVVRDDEIRMQENGEPSYTINTLDWLRKEYGNTVRFRLLTGEDNLRILTKWKSWERLVTEYGLVVYPREESNKEGKGGVSELISNLLNQRISERVVGEQITMLENVRLWNVSSTEIRRWIACGEWTQVKDAVPQGVYDYIRAKGLCRKA